MSLKRREARPGKPQKGGKASWSFFSVVQKKEVIESLQLLYLHVRFGSCAPATGIQFPGCEMMQKAKKGTFQLEIRAVS